MSALKSNSLSVSAEAIRMLILESDTLALESVDRAIEAGRQLCMAKEECKHGEWLPFLKRAEVPERKAQRLMQLARSGFKSDTVSDFGGIKATLEFLSKRQLPGVGEALCITPHSDEGNPFRSELAAFVWPSAEHPGHFFVAGMKANHATDGCSIVYTKRAVSGGDILCGDDQFMNPVWSLVERNMVVPPTEWHFFPESDGVSDVIARVLALDHAEVADLAA